MLREWPAGGPKVLWEKKVGSGWAAPVYAQSADLKAIQQQISAMQNQMESMQRQITTLQGQLGEANARVSAAETRAAAHAIGQHHRTGEQRPLAHAEIHHGAHWLPVARRALAAVSSSKVLMPSASKPRWASGSRKYSAMKRKLP